MDRLQILESNVKRNDSVMKNAVNFLQAAVRSPVSLAGLDRDTLVCIVSELGTRYQAADTERIELKRLVGDARSSRRQLGDLLKKHDELDNAHMMQSKGMSLP
jgi:hypothetical protein